VFDSTKTSTLRANGSRVLELLVRSLLNRENGVFMDLIRSRGLLEKGECTVDWDELWRESDKAKEKLRLARENTDRVLAEIAAKQASG
jgi:hypothetical protein